MKYFYLFLISSLFISSVEARKSFQKDRAIYSLKRAFEGACVLGAAVGVGLVINENIQTGTLTRTANIDSLPKMATFLSGIVGGAIAGYGIGHWYFTKTEREFEENKYTHLDNARKQYQTFLANGSVQNAFKTADILDVKD